MITVREMENMDFGLEIGKEYRIESKAKRSKGEAPIKRGIYLGQNGVKDCYLIFKCTRNNLKECFLKIDIITGVYEIRDLVKGKGAIANV